MFHIWNSNKTVISIVDALCFGFDAMEVCWSFVLTASSLMCHSFYALCIFMFRMHNNNSNSNHRKTKWLKRLRHQKMNKNCAHPNMIKIELKYLSLFLSNTEETKTCLFNQALIAILFVMIIPIFVLCWFLVQSNCL